MSLRTRIAVAGGAVVAAALLLVALVLYPAVEANLRNHLDQTLATAAEQAPTMAAALKAKVGREGADPKFPLEPVGLGTIELQIVPEPVAAGPSDQFVDLTDRDVAVAAGRAGPYFRDVDFQGIDYRVYTAQFPGSPGSLVRTATPASDPDSILRELFWLLTASAAAATVLAVVASRLAARRVLRPVARLTQAIEHIRDSGDLTIPVPAGGTDEIGRLGSAFAAMTAALDGSVGAQRRLVADASHELRTPLTSLTVNLTLLAENPADDQAPQLAADALAQTGELTRLVNDLVDLARYGEPPVHTEDVRLDLVAARIADRRAPHANLDLSPTLVHGDPDALERAVANLVDNAVKWTPPGGPIKIRVASGVVEVTDSGPGISDVDRPFVFDRFYRSPAARAHPGSGLGLAIVRQVAEAHGGSAEAVRHEGGGARLRLVVPEASP